MRHFHPILPIRSPHQAKGITTPRHDTTPAHNTTQHSIRSSHMLHQRTAHGAYLHRTARSDQIWEISNIIVVVIIISSTRHRVRQVDTHIGKQADIDRKKSMTIIHLSFSPSPPGTRTHLHP